MSWLLTVMILIGIVFFIMNVEWSAHFLHKNKEYEAGEERNGKDQNHKEKQ